MISYVFYLLITLLRDSRAFQQMCIRDSLRRVPAAAFYSAAVSGRTDFVCGYEYQYAPECSRCELALQRAGAIRIYNQMCIRDRNPPDGPVL